MQVRRVVTGQDAGGKAIVKSDEIVEAGGENQTIGTMLWGADALPHFPNDGTPPPFEGVFPTVGGYRFVVMEIAPDSQFPDKKQRMHDSDTVDLQVVLSGELSMELDDGVMVHVKRGEFIIQNGTIHRWFNRGSEPAFVLAVVVGGHPRAKK
jgi:mannose-6-phosphate isomerase-like protein (cupin superfamily)